MISFVATNVGDPNSGVATVVRELSSAIAANKVPVSLIAKERDTNLKMPAVQLEVVHSISELSRKIMRSESEVFGIHGFWAPSLIVGCAAALAARRRVILSPHGMFSAYSFAVRGARKRLALSLGARHLLERIDAFHATCEAEANEIRALGFRQPIHVIPNGVSTSGPKFPKSQAGKRKLLFMSRIHPKKGLLMLVDTWAKLAPMRPEWSLVIAGPDEDGHASEIASRAAKLGVEVSFVGPLSGNEKSKALAEADLFVLPTANENFGIVVAEALAAGTPVITTTGAPWQVLQEYDAGWWIPQEPDALGAALSDATKLPRETLVEMGQRGAEMVARNFAWRPIAKLYAAAAEDTLRLARAS